MRPEKLKIPDYIKGYNYTFPKSSCNNDEKSKKSNCFIF